mgnify:CR=1 FL=1
MQCVQVDAVLSSPAYQRGDVGEGLREVGGVARTWRCMGVALGANTHGHTFTAMGPPTQAVHAVIGFH